MNNIKENRHLYIGGSDIPTIMNINSFKSIFDLLLEKAQLQEDMFVGNEFTDYGNIMEKKIREHINNGIKDHFKEDTKVLGDLRGNCDGVNETTVLEIKTTGISNIRKTLKGYTNYLVQLLFYMQIFEKDKGVLAVYQRPRDFSTEFNKDNLQTFEIDIKDHQELLNEINEAIEQFRIDLEKVKENPFITEKELEEKNE